MTRNQPAGLSTCVTIAEIWAMSTETCPQIIPFWACGPMPVLPPRSLAQGYSKLTLCYKCAIIELWG